MYTLGFTSVKFHTLVCLDWKSKLVSHGVLFHMACLSYSVLPFELTVRFFICFSLISPIILDHLPQTVVIFQSQMEIPWPNPSDSLVSLGIHTQSWSFCWGWHYITSLFCSYIKLWLAAYLFFFFFISLVLCSSKQKKNWDPISSTFLLFLLYFLDKFSLPPPTCGHLAIDPF